MSVEGESRMLKEGLNVVLGGGGSGMSKDALIVELGDVRRGMSGDGLYGAGGCKAKQN